MSAETFTTALFLITAVIAAGVLINAVFPVVYTMAGTFQSATHESDQRLRTDFKVVAAFPNTTDGGNNVFLKNIGTQRIPLADITRSDVYCGPGGVVNRATFTYSLVDLAPANDNWDAGETLAIFANDCTGVSGDTVYFQFVLPDGIWRSIDIPVS